MEGISGDAAVDAACLLVAGGGDHASAVRCQEVAFRPKQVAVEGDGRLSESEATNTAVGDGQRVCGTRCRWNGSDDCGGGGDDEGLGGASDGV